MALLAGRLILGGGQAPAKTVSNPTRLYSPSGHLPNQPNGKTNVAMAWSLVDGASGYWWATVPDFSRLPEPRIRPSGYDGKVFFEFQGRGYFVLRTAFEIDGRLEWSDELVYGPIVVDESIPVPAEPAASSAPASGQPSQRRAGSASGSGGSSSAASDEREPPPPDPRFAGEAGEPGTGSGEAGGAGQPGQPPQEPGSGSEPGQDGQSPGRQGRDGPQGPDGYP